jgi:hypothetical protein
MRLTYEYIEDKNIKSPLICFQHVSPLHKKQYKISSKSKGPPLKQIMNPAMSRTYKTPVISHFNRAVLGNMCEKLRKILPELAILNDKDVGPEKKRAKANSTHDLLMLDANKLCLVEKTYNYTFPQAQPIDELSRIKVVLNLLDEIKERASGDDKFSGLRHRFKKLRTTLVNILICNDNLNEDSAVGDNGGHHFYRPMSPYLFLTDGTSRSDCMEKLGFSHGDPDAKSFQVFLAKVLTDMKDDVTMAVKLYLNPMEVPTQQNPFDMVMAICYLLNRMSDKDKAPEDRTDGIRFPLSDQQQGWVQYIERILKYEVSAWRKELEYTNPRYSKAGSRGEFDNDWFSIWFVIFSTVFMVFGICLLLFRELKKF